MTTTAERILDHLKGYDLRSEGEGKYRSNSPLRPGSNGHSFTVMIRDGEFGAFKDWAGNDEGSLYHLADLLGIPKPELAGVPETKREYKDMADYAQAHGIPVQVLKDARWEEVTYQGRRALKFPTRGGTRYRFLDTNGKPYTNETGNTKCWYGLDKAVKMAQEQNAPLILCNGEISTIAAQHHGLPAACVTSGEGKIPDALLPEFQQKWDGEVWIVMDTDKKGYAATAKLKAQIPNAKIIDLMLGEKADLADFCMLHPDSPASTLAALTLPSAPPLAEGGFQAILDGIQTLSKLRREGEQESPTAVQVVEQLRKELSHFERKHQPIKTLRFEDAVRSNSGLLSEAIKNPQTVLGLRTHLPKIDRALGGWRKGRTHIVYADTNMGKSTVTASITAEFVRQSAGLVLSTESPPLHWFNKLVSAMTRIPYDQIDEGRLTPEQYSQVLDAYDTLANSKSRMLDSTNPTPAMLRKGVLEAKEEEDIDWVIIDSLSKMRVPGITDLYEKTSICADAIQELAIEADVMILATCQIGRNTKGRANKMPQLHDALGSGTVEMNADVVMSLYRHDYYVSKGEADPDPSFPPNSALVQVLKHRWKPAGAAVMLMMVGGATFYELENEAGLKF